MTEPTDMSEREYFNQFARRTGMFIGRPSLKGVTAFLIGYDQAARRHGGPGREGADTRLPGEGTARDVRNSRAPQISMTPGQNG
ncbi:hypothetical protein [Nonomuraea sp. NPDC005692]|uniref:hypothetical protein n=1 Tax=Nonomuraea sp. NPDC005692 TaxID=3157168 RepID=UPI0033D959D6